MPAPFDLRFFDPHAASPALWARYHHYRRARSEEDQPGEPMLSDAEFEHGVRRRWAVNESRRFIAFDGDAVVGNLFIEMRRADTPDFEAHAPFVTAGGGVLTPYRRRGVASALLGTLADFMRAHGKQTATLNVQTPEAHALLDAVGATPKHRYAENRMALAPLDWDALAQWRAQVSAVPGLRWEMHAGRVPMDRLATLMAPFTALINDIPIGALDMPAMRYELPVHVTWYEELDRVGGEHLLAMLVNEAGEVAAVCNAHRDARFPDRVFQALTAVARPSRGHGLAKAVKAAMLALVRERLPAVRTIVTFNADVNAPMLSINDRLGFAVHRRNTS